jgi:hypothetical protein
VVLKLRKLWRTPSSCEKVLRVVNLTGRNLTLSRKDYPMKDSELRGIVLQKYYAKREKDGFSGRLKISRICRKRVTLMLLICSGPAINWPNTA